MGGTYLNSIWTDDRDGNYEVYSDGYRYIPPGFAGLNVAHKDRFSPISAERGVHVSPNPFSSFTSVVGEERGACYTLFDVSGRVVGSYRGERIGSDVFPGVYFLLPQGNNVKPVRIVKVR